VRSRKLRVPVQIDDFQHVSSPVTKYRDWYSARDTQPDARPRHHQSHSAAGAGRMTIAQHFGARSKYA
jgi:hypothetical protein